MRLYIEWDYSLEEGTVKKGNMKEPCNDITAPRNYSLLSISGCQHVCVYIALFIT